MRYPESRQEEIVALSPANPSLFSPALDKTTICRRRSREYRLMAHESVNEKLRVENDDPTAFLNSAAHTFRSKSRWISINYSRCPTNRVFPPRSIGSDFAHSGFSPFTSPPGKNVSSKESRGFDGKPTRV